jgi:xanthine dehydrogenase YagS FAD-binding subunit
MEAFAYARPKTREEAVGLLGPDWADSVVLAGGTDLISLMKNYVVSPKRLVDIKRIPDLGGVSRKGDVISLGATLTLQELVDDKTIQSGFRGLVEAAAGVPSMQMRNMGTVGGDLCQRPRCWYFRNGFGLLARDAKGKSLVPEGDNRYHAILGNEGPAYFVNPSSLAPMLMALGAQAIILKPGGSRTLALAEFFRVPKSEDKRETALEPNELLIGIHFPAGGAKKTATYEVREKQALDWPLATASVALEMSGNTVHSARIVLGHVAPIPWRATGAEEFLSGKTLTEENAAKAGEAAVRNAKPLSANKYKVQLARVAVKRALLQAGRA